MSFTDAFEQNGVVSYRTGLFAFEEGMSAGRLCALSYNAAGYLMAANPRPKPTYMDTAKFARPESFLLTMDGQELCAGWEMTGFETKREGDLLRCALTLSNSIRPVAVRILTELDGTPVIRRVVAVENCSDVPQAVASCMPLSGGVMQISYPRMRVTPGSAPFRAGYLQGTTWGMEGDFRWHDLPDTVYSVCGRYRRDRHRHPMFLLESVRTGDMLIAQLGWSGGYRFDYNVNLEERDAASVSISVGPDAPAPIRVLAPGEVYKSPEVHFGMVHGCLDDAVNAMHAHLRKSVLPPPTLGVTGWVESGIGPEYDMDRESTIRAIELAHASGAEVFFIDAGWYLPPDREEDWWARCGDWTPDADRYPNGIGELRDLAHARGMKFGMWMDAERIGNQSRVAREHPDWIARNYAGADNGAGLLDLANQEVVSWVEAQIDRLLSEIKIDMFRLDYNVGCAETMNALPARGYLENSQARYYENIYAMYARLRARHPDAIFENCAGGGGRSDVGMLGNFTHTWVTDWQIHPNAFRITNGMTMALPPEYVDRLIGGQAAYLTGELTTQMRNLLFARPSVGIIRPLSACDNPEQLAIVRHYVDLYKSFVRPMHADLKVFHHTPELPGDTATGVGVIELAGAGRGMLGAFRLDSGADHVFAIPKGARADRTYEVTFDATGARFRLSGYELLRGLRLELPAALASELLLYREID